MRWPKPSSFGAQAGFGPKVGLLLSSTDELITGVNNFSLALHNNERKALYYALRHAQIPVDHFDKRPMTMVEFCRGGEAGQLTIPLHPGAKKYFREKGYLD